MKMRTREVGFWVLIIGFIAAILTFMFVSCNGDSPDPDPEPCEISYLVTETETGTVATVLKDNIEILRIEATNGEQGIQGVDGANGADGTSGIDGQDCAFPDTIYLKDLDSGVMKLYAVSSDPLPPTRPNPDTLYVADVVLEGDTWIYILRGDSLKIFWSHSYKDMNGRDIDPSELYFHVAYTMGGVTHSLKPFENVTQELSLVMKGLSEGDIIPCVSAYTLDGEVRRYSTWAKSTNYGWYCRRE